MLNGENWDFTNGKSEVHQGESFDHHCILFKAGVTARTKQIVPCYSKPVCTKYNEVSFSFNKGVVTGLFQGQLGFEGVLLRERGLIINTVF